MQENGLNKEEILKILEKKLEKDFSYNSSSILGSMCTEPLDFGVEIYMKYLSKNLGDPGLFLGTAALEEELVSEIGDLFNGKNIIGTFTTGGSEANLIAMRIAKKLNKSITKPEVVVPCSAHISFDKAADLLGIKLRKAKLTDNFELDLAHFESLINNNTCGVVGIAGTTSLGLIDPIGEIGKFIEDKGIFFVILTNIHQLKLYYRFLDCECKRMLLTDLPDLKNHTIYCINKRCSKKYSIVELINNSAKLLRGVM